MARTVVCARQVFAIRVWCCQFVLFCVDHKFAFVCFKPRLPCHRHVCHSLWLPPPSLHGSTLVGPTILDCLPVALLLCTSPTPVSAASFTCQLVSMVSLQHKHPPTPQTCLSHVPLLHTLIPISSPAPIVLVCYWSTAVACRCSPISQKVAICPINLMIPTMEARARQSHQEEGVLDQGWRHGDNNVSMI